MSGTETVTDTLPTTPWPGGDTLPAPKALHGGTWLDVLRDTPQTGHRFGRALLG